MYKNIVTTWDNDKELNDTYEYYRQQHFKNTKHRLYSNYSKNHVSELSAKSIYWGNDGEPKIICSILARSCWPDDTYRILNRLWKPNLNSGAIFDIDQGFGMLVKDQLDWSIQHGANAVFMSRQTDGKWQQWASKILTEMTGIEFYLPPEKFLTCENESDSSCWQKIIFYGDKSKLNTWSNTK
jgi:hypothetical protein